MIGRWWWHQTYAWGRFATERAMTRLARLFGYYIYVGRMPPSDSIDEHVGTLLSQLQINCVIDVGAHFGEFGVLLRDIGYRGDIVSFEPVPENFTVLKRQAAGDPKWKHYQLAVGDCDGEASMYITNAANLSSLLRPIPAADPGLLHGMELKRVARVQVCRLDNMLDECVGHIRRPRIYLKTDAQGYDMQVIRGAANCLGDIPAVQAEVIVRPMYEGETGYLKFMAQMNAMGFELTALVPVLRDDALRLIAFDCVMIQGARLGAPVGN